MAALNLNDELKELQKTIDETPVLKGNVVMDDSVNSLKKELDKPETKESQKNDPKTFEELGAFIKVVSTSIKTFNNDKSNDADILSGILSITSAFVKLVGVLSGAGPEMAVLTKILSVAGSAFGLFGTKKENYMDKVESLVQSLKNQEVQIGLRTDLELMKSENANLVDYLSKYSVSNAEKLKNIATGINLKELADLGVTAEANAVESLDNALPGKNNLAKNMTKENKHADELALTYFYLCQHAGYKIMFMIESVAYFQLYDIAMGIDPCLPTSNTDTARNSLKRFIKDNVNKLQNYLIRPDLRHAAVTHAIYRLPKERFSLAAGYSFLTYNAVAIKKGQPIQNFWPIGAKPYAFTNGNESNLVRLATMNTFWEPKNKPGSVLINKRVFFSKDEIKVESDTYFSLNVSDSLPEPLPPYRWKLQAQNSYEEIEMGGSSTKPMGKSISITTHEEGFYMFQVFPSEDEWNEKEWTSDKRRFKHTDRPMLMIGNAAKNKVWCNYRNWQDHLEWKQEKYHEVFKTSSYGSPSECIWFILGKDDYQF